MKKILIFGGSGFIGAKLSKFLSDKNHQITVICSNYQKANKKFSNYPNIKIEIIDIFDENILSQKIKKYDIIINLIGKLFEIKKGDFKKYHQDFVNLLVKHISSKQRLIHISALAIENSSKTSIYAQTKLKAEKDIIHNVVNYNIIKPSIIFGPEDNFFNLFAKMAKLSPFLPLIGGGKSKFAPIYVGDIISAIDILINNPKYNKKIFEAYGEEVSFKELIKFILNTINKKRLLINMPFNISKLYARFFNLCKIYLITSDQIELLKYNNIKSNKYDNICNIIEGKLHSYKDIVPSYI